MRSLSILLSALIVICSTTACKKSKNSTSVEQAMVPPKTETSTTTESHSGIRKVFFPQEDPGAPLYARMTRILNQFFVADGWLVIPFLRDPSCIRADFNLLDLFDIPGAFGCTSTVGGFYLIENDAAPGTFPIQAQSTGTAVPFWLVRWDAFQEAAVDGMVTIAELRALEPLTGVATQFKETLRPRTSNHFVQISAAGLLDDGRRFNFHGMQRGEKNTQAQLRIW
jgi:hypothetical protein